MVGFLDHCNCIDDGYHWVLLHEGIDWDWWWIDGSECGCTFGDNVWAGKEEEFEFGTFWSNGACWGCWREFSVWGFRAEYRVEVVVLFLVGAGDIIWWLVNDY